MEILIYGIVNSIVLALMAFGFTLVYGVSRLPNFAHGALYVLAGFVAWSFLISLGLPYVVAIILAIAIAGLVGALIYRIFLIRVRGMPEAEIIASYAFGLAILEGLRWGGFIGHSFILPVFVDGSVTIAGIPIDWQRIIIVIAGTAILTLLWLFTHYTKMGLALRAIAQDERAALMLGIDSDRAALISLALGSALAGIAGLLILPLGNITVERGYSVLIYALAVCIIGGLGSWTGAIIAAFLLGFVQIITVYIGASQWQMVVIIAAIMLTLLFKPSGLFGRQKELEERV